MFWFSMKKMLLLILLLGHNATAQRRPLKRSTRSALRAGDAFMRNPSICKLQATTYPTVAHARERILGFDVAD